PRPLARSLHAATSSRAGDPRRHRFLRLRVGRRARRGDGGPGPQRGHLDPPCLRADGAPPRRNRRLLKHLERITPKPILIGTWSDASWAIHFYEKNGFFVLDVSDFQSRKASPAYRLISSLTWDDGSIGAQ